jgi:transposase
MEPSIADLYALIKELSEKVDALSQVQQPTPFTKKLISIREVAFLLGVTPKTIYEYKKSWQEGIHYFPQARGDRFNAELIQDWQRNRANPNAHQRAIDNWVLRQPENRKKKRRSA